MATIKTERFTLRTYKRGDEHSLQQNINDKLIARNTMTIPHPYTMRHARDYVSKCIAESKKRKPENQVFAIDLEGRVIGAVGLHHIEKHQAEIGYWLGKKYWGQGLMPEAVRAVTRYALNQLGLHRVYAKIFTFNKASQRVVEKSGYSYEGRFHKGAMKNGRLIDELIYAKTR
ncbi:GNAT family N-acetyltransferase [Candidatus Woesearchaeota archaeon]|nr:GNAT family N-acetyltransferase [Candidatus Woesearchaeota archaeon]